MALDIETGGGIPAVDEELLRRVRERDAALPVQGGIAGLYAPSIRQAVQRQLSNPAPEPEPTWSTWALTKALGGGFVSGGLEYSGSVADLASGAAAPMAATGGSAGGMFALPSDAERQQEEDARQRMLKGPAFDPKMGNVMRAKAGEFAPDPITSHKSAQILHGLTSGVGKAVGSAVTFGPLAGAVVFGAEEGNTAAQNLMVSGVDGETAAKVGAVTAVASAVGAGLPVAGKTIAKTVALALTGGPGTYVAQEALSRKILADAGHQAQAEMHDPFDPVMLALSTVIPGAMGALAMRQAARAAARAKASEPARTEPGKEAQPPEPAPRAEAEPVKAVPHDTDAIAARAAEDPAAADAARVRVLEDAEAKHIPTETPPGNERGIDAVRESVESGDMAPAVRMAAEQEARAPLQTETTAFKEWFGNSKVVSSEGGPMVVYHGTRGDISSFDQGAIGSRFGMSDGFYFTSDAHSASQYADSIANAVNDWRPGSKHSKPVEPGANVVPAYVRIDNPKIIETDGPVEFAVDMGDGEVIRDARAAGHDGVIVRRRRGDGFDSDLVIAFKPEQIKSAIGNSGRFDPQSVSLTDHTSVAAPRDIGQPETPGAERRGGDVGDEEPKPATPEQETSRLSSAVDEISNADPNTIVQLPGHDTPMKLSEAMELIDQQTKELLQQGDFVKAAATCALMSGM